MIIVSGHSNACVFLFYRIDVPPNRALLINIAILTLPGIALSAKVCAKYWKMILWLGRVGLRFKVLSAETKQSYIIESVIYILQWFS